MTCFVPACFWSVCGYSARAVPTEVTHAQPKQKQDTKKELFLLKFKLQMVCIAKDSNENILKILLKQAIGHITQRQIVILTLMDN